MILEGLGMKGNCVLKSFFIRFQNLRGSWRTWLVSLRVLKEREKLQRKKYERIDSQGILT